MSGDSSDDVIEGPVSDIHHTQGGRFQVYVKSSTTDPENSGVRHSYVWWFEPVMQTGPEDARIQPARYLHKQYTDACTTLKPTEEHEGEEVITHLTWHEAAEELDMSDVPDPVIESLMDWFGRTLIQRSLEHDGGALPLCLMECLDCEAVVETEYRRTCPECGSDSTVRHESRETVGENREILQYLADAEVAVSMESPAEVTENDES